MKRGSPSAKDGIISGPKQFDDKGSALHSEKKMGASIRTCCEKTLSKQLIRITKRGWREVMESQGETKFVDYTEKKESCYKNVRSS